MTDHSVRRGSLAYGLHQHRRNGNALHAYTHNLKSNIYNCASSLSTHALINKAAFPPAPTKENWSHNRVDVQSMRTGLVGNWFDPLWMSLESDALSFQRFHGTGQGLGAHTHAHTHTHTNCMGQCVLAVHKSLSFSFQLSNHLIFPLQHWCTAPKLLQARK